MRFLSWVGGHEVAVLLALGCAAAGIWLFGALAGEVLEGDTQTFDRRILVSLSHSTARTPYLGETARDTSALGSVFVLGLLTAATAGFLSLNGKRNMALFLCASITSGLIAASVLKGLFHRPRPDLVPHADFVATTSFPSGHSMLSAITYLTLAALLARSWPQRRLKAYFLVLAAFLTFIVGVSRVCLGVHWPTDVLAGWTAGVVWALLSWLVARWLQRGKTLEPEAALTAPEV